MKTLWVAVWSHQHGLNVALYRSQEQCLLGLADCVLREIQEGEIRDGDLIRRVIRAYREARFHDVLSIYSVETDGWMECHEASDTEPEMQAWTAEELQGLERIPSDD
jgi:hypothetical protein